MRLEETPFTVHWFRRKMKKYFPMLPAGEYIDVQMVALKKECHIDVMKLDDWLHQEFGEYEELYEISMFECIWLFVSEDAARWVRSAL